MGIYAVKPAFQKKLKPLENLFVRYRVHPTFINLLGLCAAAIAASAILLSQSYPLTLLLVPLMTTFRTACNALDGLVSRRLGVASAFGEVLNELIDRIADSLIFGSIFLLSVSGDALALSVIIVILLNSYLSILSKAAGASRQYGGFMGKADRMIYVSIAAVIILLTNSNELWNWYLWFTLIGTLITFAQRFSTTRKELMTSKKQPKQHA